jgi:hypothetical protein
MSTILAQKIQREIIDWYNSESVSDEEAEYFEEVIDEFVDSISWGTSVTLPSGEAKEIEQKGGEGEGEEYWVVFRVGDDKFFRVEGYYTSWEGTNWENAEVIEVEPAQVLVTVYKEKSA